MREGRAADLVTDVHQRLSMIRTVIPPERFEALARTIMKAIGAEAMSEAERRSGLLHESPAPRPTRGNVIRFPSRPPGQATGTRGAEHDIAAAAPESPATTGGGDDGSDGVGGDHG